MKDAGINVAGFARVEDLPAFEAAGLKGFSIGGAEVSEKHANFIINTGDATATDIEELIEHVRQKVIEEHGIELVHEVRIVGEVAQ